MNQVVEYHEFASQCLRLAARAAGATDKAQLTAMAQRWISLANRVQRIQGMDFADIENLKANTPPPLDARWDV